MAKHLLFLFIFWCPGVCLIAEAQIDDCELMLNQATEEFNKGHFYGIAAMLKPCIDRGFSREQRQRAYLLLTQTYLLLDDPIGAENSYLSLLQANPEFLADPARDPIDVVYLSKKFTAEPIFSLFGKLGINTSPVHVIEYVNITGEPIRNKYILKPGWMMGVGADWHINEKVSVEAELQYAFTAYRREQSGLFENTSSTDLLDRQNWINIPLSVKYTGKVGKLYPYAYLGFSVNLLLADRASIVLTDEAPFNLTESPVIKYSPRRTALNRSLLLGVGSRYKVDLNYLFVDIRYSMGLTNLFDYQGAYLAYDGGEYVSDAILESGNPVFRFATIDNFFRLNNLYLTVGYTHPLYKPRKLKRARTKAILKDIQQGE